MTTQAELQDNTVAYEIVCAERPTSAEAVNETCYFQANPDVAASGQSATEHFTRFGKGEGRVQYVNAREVGVMRDSKLARLRFRRSPRVPRLPGKPIDFLTDAIIQEFAIPEAPPVSANQYGGPFIAEIAAHPERLCLDVGAGLRYRYAENVVNTEIYPSISTDVLCIGEDLPFADAQFDYAICAAVLEHTRRPWEVAREICRVVKPGGRILIDWPLLQGVHGYPNHYFNATPEGAISVFSDWCDNISSTIESNNHPMHALWWLLNIWHYGLPEAEARTFDALTMGEVLAMPAGEHTSASYCTMLDDNALRTIPAGSTLIATRRSDPLLSEARGTRATELNTIARVAALEQEVALLRASHSWRLMAPLRAIGSVLKRL